ncbi:hypothetical protein LCM20_15910 [Halobacillus litoralis]|uniref:hypothetical protein n=1 Tax=Halobacillus litoralis TaxID=45668 RepID=UPI001CD726A7|nr:hypothetical protein [Halobacillus litoralis]MCA0972093.1 hypothetical protein [Halobacillus litoralis]
MSEHKKSGDQHVKQVASYIKKLVKDENPHSIITEDKLAYETAQYIYKRFPAATSIYTKFEKDGAPDHFPDLMIRENQDETEVNLFKVKGNGIVQPKNLGAKSFLKQYFKSETLQKKFNRFFEESHRKFFIEILIELQGYKSAQLNTLSIRQLKQHVKKHYQSFTDELEPYREKFLSGIRDYCFSIFIEEYNEGSEGFKTAFNALLMPNALNVISRYKKDGETLRIETFEPGEYQSHDVSIHKRGGYSLSLGYHSIALNLRFKFESSPLSSIKLATSYEELPSPDESQVTNLKTVQEFENFVSNHNETEKENKSNAIGKCNEAAVQYAIIKNYPSVIQVTEDECIGVLRTYAPRVAQKELFNIMKTAQIAMDELNHFLTKLYSDYKLESVQLTGDSYIEDTNETGDIKILIRSQNRYYEESFSLKAYQRTLAKITSKNPGAGQILGEKYFDVGTLKPLLKNLKENYEPANRQQSLETVSERIGEALSEAANEKLIKGVQALLGTRPLIISFYLEQKAHVVEHGKVNGKITVLRDTPTSIQNRLTWNNAKEELDLRIKFGSGGQHGWSSMKLACDYKIKEHL